VIVQAVTSKRSNAAGQFGLSEIFAPEVKRKNIATTSDTAAKAVSSQCSGEDFFTLAADTGRFWDVAGERMSFQSYYIAADSAFKFFKIQFLSADYADFSR
jgi:hypothetical protein